MKAVKIAVSPFAFTHIRDIRIERGPNRHGSFWIRGDIPEDMEAEYISRSSGAAPVTVTAQDAAGNKRLLFCGILEDMRMKVLNGSKVMEIRVCSYSKMLDVKPGVTVFQNPDLAYDELVKATLSPYEDADAICACGAGKAIGRMYARYQETDWAFLVRMASSLQDVVVSHDLMHGIRLYFGFKAGSTYNSNSAPIDPIEYEVQKNVGGYVYKKENKVAQATESNSICYVIKEREVRDIGDAVEFLGRPYRIAAIESFWEGRELVHRYTLADPAGLKVPQSFNYVYFAMKSPSARSNKSTVTLK